MTGRPLRIVHVIARLNVGGAALHVLQLAHEQKRRGHDVLVVAGTLAAGEESMEYLADELDVPLHRLPALQRELSLRNDAKAIRELRRIVRARRPDVLHTHTAKAGATGRIAAVLGGRPGASIHTYHGHVLSGYFGHGRERAFRTIERVLGRTTDALVAVSAEVRDDLVAFGVAPAGRFAVIPYGFELSALANPEDDARKRLREQLEIESGTFVVGWAGRLTAIKRPLDLVRTLRALVDAGIDAVLVVVGDGEDRVDTEVCARELDVWDRCRFVGYQRRLQDWYGAFDAFLLTSANEGTPVAAIEALAAGRPVVATRAGGTGAVVEDGVSGYLAAIGDTEALAGRLAALARDDALRARMGERGAEDMLRRFTTERMTDELDALYRRVVRA